MSVVIGNVGYLVDCFVEEDYDFDVVVLVVLDYFVCFVVVDLVDLVDFVVVVLIFGWCRFVYVCHDGWMLCRSTRVGHFQLPMGNVDLDS